MQTQRVALPDVTGLDVEDAKQALRTHARAQRKRRSDSERARLGDQWVATALDFIGDACDSVDSLQVGDEIDANYRLSGRKCQRDPQSEVKYFLSAEALSFKLVGSGSGNKTSGDINEALSEASYDD